MKFFILFKETTIWISRMMIYLAAVFIAFMMLITVIDVAGRSFLNKPLKGTIELAEFCMVIVAALGIGWATVKEAHAKVDIIVSRFSNRAQAFFDILGYLISMTTLGLIAWQGFLETKSVFSVTKEVSDLYEIPLYPFFFIFSVGFFVTCMVLFVKIGERLREIWK